MRTRALLITAVAFSITLLPGPWGDERVTDLYLYESYADLFLGGAQPYADVSFEYPPLAAPVIALPGVFGSGDGAYRMAFAALALALLAALVVLVGALARRSSGDPRRAMLAAAAAPLLIGATLRTHFDLAPVVLTLGALLAVVAARPRLGMALLGAGAMTKAFPLVAAPVVVAWLVARGRGREAVESTGALALVIAVVAGAALVMSASGAIAAVRYHAERPAQVESAPAIVLLGLDGAGLGRAAVVHSHGSEGVDHPAADAVIGIFSFGLIGSVALMTLLAARRPDTQGLLLASLGAVSAFAAFGKVLSPQFLIWVVPLAALAFAWGRPALALTAASAIGLTLVEFPAHYADVVAREPAALVLVGARDALLIAVVVLTARELALSRAPERGSARSRWLARPGPPRPAPH